MVMVIIPIMTACIPFKDYLQLMQAESQYSNFFLQKPEYLETEIRELVTNLANYDLALLSHVMSRVHLKQEEYRQTFNSPDDIITMILTVASGGIVHLDDGSQRYILHDSCQDLYWTLAWDPCEHPTEYYRNRIVSIMNDIQAANPELFTALRPIFSLENDHGYFPGQIGYQYPDWTPNAHYFRPPSQRSQVEIIFTLMNVPNTVWFQMPQEITQIIVASMLEE